MRFEGVGRSFSEAARIVASGGELFPNPGHTQISGVNFTLVR